MRHPTTGLSEDDLSRLTGSSSSTASCSHSSSSSNSSSSSTSPTSTPARIEQQQQQQPLHVADAEKDFSAHDAEQFKNLKNSSTNNSAHFNSSYLPEFIDPLDWQKSRKRKDRLDSTSSSTQDRKLIRSNSEEQLPPPPTHQQQQQQQKEQKELKEQKEQRKQHQEQPQQHHQEQPKDDAEHKISSNVRRVASEDFKKLHYSAFDFDSASADTDAVLDPRSAKAAAFNGGDENDAYAANRQTPQQQQQPTQYEASHAREMTRRTRYETSPARSHRHSPNRLGSAAKYHRDSDDSECEHERRRSSERFSKTRAPPGRKASGVMKKSGKYLPTKMRGDENAYKYDLSALKYERRGFVSKLVSGERATSAPATVADHNDNNLIDFHIMRNSNGQNEAAVAATKKNAAECNSNSNKSNNSSTTNNTTTTTSAEALPWCKADQSEPVLSRRYATVRHRPADCIDTAAKLSKVMPYPQQFHKQSPTQLLAATEDDDEGIDTYRAFTSLENLKTREVMHQLMPAMMSFQSPEERLKQVNKRLTALKKKLVQFEQGFETRMGYRPSQAEKQNDKYMKNVMAELSKLRKEKHELRVDPLGALGFKVSGGMDATKKLEKMRDTLDEIEQNLSDKREDSNRSETLDELTADQLLQEKTAVQHGLLYFESQYGRPSTKDERDAARPLYDRYRQLKRMVSRSIAISGCASAGVSELPTILEHEAMVFESMPQHYSSNNSTESSSNTPTSESQPTNTTTATTSSSANNASSDDSETTTTTGNVEVAAAGPTSTSSFENISALNIEQLWEQLDKTREQKKQLKRTIREFETVFEEQNGRKMLKSDRKLIEETYAQYKEQKAKTRLLQALIKKHISR